MDLEKAQKVSNALNIIREIEHCKSYTIFNIKAAYKIPQEIIDKAKQSGKAILDEYFDQKIKEAEAHLKTL